MNKKAIVSIERGHVIGEISKNLFGSFIEHMGRTVYTGIYEPDHPFADEDGFRKDVIDLVKELQVPLVRYPGGNFVSGYRWQDGIGPKENRPRRLELAWRSIETNQVGIDDFAKWAKKTGCDVMPAVNMGTGQPQDAADLVEYCNFSGGTYWSDMRRENGQETPYGFKNWCIGNEMDGDWQISHLTAQEYGRKACEAIKMMKWVDPTIKTTVVGSSSAQMPTYPEWDRIVLEHTYDVADYLSLHQYYGFNPVKDNENDYLHSYVNMDAFIQSIVATTDYVKAYKRSKKTMMLSFDEWNIWHNHLPNPPGSEWAIAPHLLENQYDVKDALLFSGMMMTLINHADRVKVGCMAQLVNVIAPILTRPGGEVLKQTIFYPYKAGCTYAKGCALKTKVSSPMVETVYGDTTVIYSAASYQEESGELTLFLLNTGKDKICTELKIEGFEHLVLKEHQMLSGELNAKNTFEQPEQITMTVNEKQEEYERGALVEMEGYSFHVFRYSECERKEF